MSRIVSIHTEFRDLEILKTCLENLHCQILHQDTDLRMAGTHIRVQLLVNASFGTLGFRHTSAGNYELVGDDMILDRQEEFINRLTQQYAYRKILKDAKAAGYNLVQEEMREDKTIKLIVRKW